MELCIVILIVGSRGLRRMRTWAESVDSNNVLKLPHELDFTDALRKAIPTKLTIGLTCVTLASLVYKQVLILSPGF